MHVVDVRLIKAIDRIGHFSTCDEDALQTVHAIRRMTKGEMISRLLNLDSDSETFIIQNELKDLQRKIERLERDKAKLEKANEELRQDRTRLQQQLVAHDTQRINDDGKSRADDSYTYDAVMAIVRQKIGKHAGGMKMWADYSARLVEDYPDRSLVTVGKQASWRKQNAFPAWAVQQLLDMPVEKKEFHRWSRADIDFLRDLHLADPLRSDDDLAAACSTEFGCHINSNSVKGKMVLLRRLGEIPLRRPKK